MDETFITLHRKITKSACFQDADLLKVFIWCLVKANFKDREVIHGGQLINLKRGQFITGRFVASEELKMSEKKYRNRLDNLRRLNQIQQKGANKYTIISVVNYDYYQSGEDKRASKGPAKGQQRATDNKDNKVNNPISDKSPTMSFNKNKEEDIIDFDGDGETQEAPRPQTKKYPNAPTIRKIFQEVLGRNPAIWKMNKNQLQACENLYTERTPKSVRSALEYSKENSEEKYCPKISSPYDLDSKWTQLGEFKIKQNGN